jgi:hypothetical protein
MLAGDTTSMLAGDTINMLAGDTTDMQAEEFNTGILRGQKTEHLPARNTL